MNSILIRSIYRLKKRKDRLCEKKRNPEIFTDAADQAAYEKIKELLPALRDYKESTILHIKKRALQKGCGTLSEYLAHLASSPAEQDDLRVNLTLKGSHFFRGQDWPYFTGLLKKCLENKDRVRVWCAGCAGGKEVYSLLLCLSEFLPPGRIVLLASDYNETLLAECRAGVYSLWCAGEIPEQYHALLLSAPPDKCRPRFTFPKEMRDLVRTEKIDLLSDPYPDDFDLILCRNVIKFFSPEAASSVKSRLASSLSPGGILFLSEDPKEKIPAPEKLGLAAYGERPVYRKRSCR